MNSIKDLLNHKKGDILSLSSLMVMEDHSKEEVDIIITEVRTYHEPNDAFNYTAYIGETEEEDPTKYMLLVRQIDDEYDLMLYYLDTDGDISESREILITEDGEDFVDRFELGITDAQDKQHDVTWDKQHSFFGVEHDNGNDSGIKTLGLFFTNDECGGTPHAFIEWTGNTEAGYIELWIGCEIKTHEVSILSVGDDEDEDEDY